MMRRNWCPKGRSLRCMPHPWRGASCLSMLEDAYRPVHFLDVFSGTALINAHARCGRLQDARRAFDAMREHNVISWTAIISAYAKHNEFGEAFLFFERMLLSGVAPDKVTFMVLLKACASLVALELGKQVHAHIIKSSLNCNIFVGNSLIDMYAKCGSIGEAHQLFEKLHDLDRDVVSWTTLITGYAQEGLGQEALDLFQRMIMEGIQPNDVTFVSILKACASVLALEQGKRIHTHLIDGSLKADLNVGNVLVDMYAKCGSIDHARQAFNTMQERDVVSWTTMIAGYAHGGLTEEAMALFRQMQQEGMEPDDFVFVSIIQVCAKLMDKEQGKQVHVHLINRGSEPDTFLVSSLICMYAECGSIRFACKVFDGISEQNLNTVPWNAMIAEYVQHANGEARKLFKEMQAKCFLPDNITFLGMLKSCSDLKQGKQLHVQISEGGHRSDVCLQNAIIDMYISCGCSQRACELFDKMQDRDVVSWNTVIAGHTQLEHFEEAFVLFERMQLVGLKPDNLTFSSILRACAGLAVMDYGKQVHQLIIQCSLEVNVYVKSALVDMYAKCGSIEEAYLVFKEMRERNIVSWNAMIAGYAQQGLAMDALRLFRQMQEDNMKPDSVTFVAVLYACSHSGLVSEAHNHFRLMSQAFRLTPTRDHYACMVDILGRAGLLDEAIDAINHMSAQPDAVVWMTLLGACRNHGNVDLGRHAFDRVLKLNPECSGAYILLSSLYGAAGRWDELANLYVTENIGNSWMDATDEALIFLT